jgi:surfactin synthase thioesterase subunit
MAQLGVDSPHTLSIRWQGKPFALLGCSLPGCLLFELLGGLRQCQVVSNWLEVIANFVLLYTDRLKK